MPFRNLALINGEGTPAPGFPRPALTLVKDRPVKPPVAKKCCGLCQPESKGEAGEALVRTLSALAEMPRFAEFKLELESAVEEITNRDLIDGIEEEELLVLEAVRLGYQWDRDIAEYTGIERDRTLYVCERLCAEEPPRLMEMPQGGKTDMARGRRKRLFSEP